MIASQTLVGLLFLTAFTEASGPKCDIFPNTQRDGVFENDQFTDIFENSKVITAPYDTVDEIGEKLATLHLDDLTTLQPVTQFITQPVTQFITQTVTQSATQSTTQSIAQPASQSTPPATHPIEPIFEKGCTLRTESLGIGMKAIAKRLNKEIGKMFKQEYDDFSAAGLLNCFDVDPEKLVNAAIKVKAYRVLRLLQLLYIWRSEEQFHWFQALSYKSKWYDKKLWKKNDPVPMDWSRHLEAILKVDNPYLLNFVMSKSVDPNDSYSIDTHQLLDLIAEHDAFNSYQYLKFTPHEQLVKRLKKLAESGSIRLLRLLIESGTVDNLHLENYSFPKRFSKGIESFKFFWVQGYRYLPISHLLKKACEEGRVDILRYLYNLDKLFMPHLGDLISATTKGHLNVLKWAKSIGSNINEYTIVSEAVTNGRFKIFRWLQREYGSSVDQNISNISAYNDQLDVVKWIYFKFKLIPASERLAKASIKMLEWVQSVDPTKIDKNLAKVANTMNLDWLWSKHRKLFTDDVKFEQVMRIDDWERLQWIFKNWGMAARKYEWAAAKGDLKSLQWAFGMRKMIPSVSTARVAAQNGKLEVLQWIYEVNPACMDEKIVTSALKYGYLEIAKYFDPILNFRKKALKVDLQSAYISGQLRVLIWAHKHYSTRPIDGWLESAVFNDHFEIIKWTVERGFLSIKRQRFYLERAVSSGSLSTCKYLSDRLKVTSKVFAAYTGLAFRNGDLKMMKFLILKDPLSVSGINYDQVGMLQYPLKQWLIDNGYCQGGPV